MVNLVKRLIGNWFMVHWLIFENFYPSLTLGALYAPWLTDMQSEMSVYLRLGAVYVYLLANILVF